MSSGKASCRGKPLGLVIVSVTVVILIALTAADIYLGGIGKQLTALETAVELADYPAYEACFDENVIPDGTVCGGMTEDEFKAFTSEMKTLFDGRYTCDIAVKHKSYTFDNGAPSAAYSVLVRMYDSDSGETRHYEAVCRFGRTSDGWKIVK